MSVHDEAISPETIDAMLPTILQIPYARHLGFRLLRDGTDIIGRMAYADALVGNPAVHALHGGTLGALMELTAVCKLLTLARTTAVPKTVDISIEFLRSAGRFDTFARATVTRHGRRVANVRIVAYQDDPQRPVAAATAHFLLASSPAASNESTASNPRSTQ